MFPVFIAANWHKVTALRIAPPRGCWERRAMEQGLFTGL